MRNYGRSAKEHERKETLVAVMNHLVTADTSEEPEGRDASVQAHSDRKQSNEVRAHEASVFSHVILIYNIALASVLF